MKKHIKLTNIFLLILILEFFLQSFFYLKNDKLFFQKKKYDKDYILSDWQVSPFALIKYKENEDIDISGYINSLYTDKYGLIHNGYEYNFDKKIILIFGGSTVEGRGASSNANTISANLYKVINKDDDLKNKYEVINMGVVGDNSYPQMQRLREYLSSSKPNPEIVIFLDGYNDIYTYLHYNSYWQQDFNGWSKPFINNTNPIINNTPFLYDAYIPFVLTVLKIDEILSSHIITFNIFKDEILLRITEKLIKQKYNNEISDKTLFHKDLYVKLSEWDNHILMNHKLPNEISKIIDFKFYHFLQPILTQNKKNLSKEEKYFLNNFHILKDQNEVEDLMRYKDKMFERYSNNLKENNWFYDISYLFKNHNQTLYIDEVHYNDKGNEIIAKQIYETIKKDL